MTLVDGQEDKQFIQLAAKGLFTMPNSLSQVPPGSLLVAKNVVIDYDGLISGRRGIKQFGDALTGTNYAVFEEFFYKGTKLIWYGNDGVSINDPARMHLAYDSDQLGTWIETCSGFSAPAYALTDTYRSAQSNGNIYLTSTTGILKTDAPENALYPAGGFPGLDGTAATVDASGFMANDTEVAYRMTWATTDQNNNTYEGVPSTRAVVSNNTGNSVNVNVTFSIPNGVTTDTQYYIYRSPQSASHTTEPSDELQLVIKGYPTSGQLTARVFTVKDTVPQSEVGAYLYTNAISGQGISQANSIPPLANDVCYFFGYLIYGAATTQNTFLMSLLATSGTGALAVGNTLTIVNGIHSVTLTAGTSEVVATGTFKLSTGGDPGSDILATKQSLIRVLNRMNQTLVYGYDATNSSSAASLPGDFYLQEQGISRNAFGIFSTNTTCWNPILASEISFTISAITDGTHLAVSSTSGLVIGDLIVQGSVSTTITGITPTTSIEVLDTTGFTATTAYDASSPNISLAGGGIGSGYCSKYLQPDSVPTSNTIAAGNKSFEWYRNLPLRNSVIVMKADGCFQLTGSTYPFTVTTLDLGTLLTAPESATIMNNQVFAYTNQGAVSITETGPGIISRPIENTLQMISSYLHPNFASSTFGTSYETDRKWILSTVSEADNYEKATIQYVYDTITETWTNYYYPVAINDLKESPTEHRLYAASADTTYPYVFQERKTFTPVDFADIEIPVTIVSYVKDIVELNSTSQVIVGWSLAQLELESAGQASRVVTISKIIKIIDATHVQIADTNKDWDITGLVFTALEQPIPILINYCPIACGNPGIIKFFMEMQAFFQSINFDIVNFTFNSDFTANGIAVPLVPQTSLGAWGNFAWGTIPWGGTEANSQSIRTYIPLAAKRAHWLNLQIDLSQAMTQFTYAGCVIVYKNKTTRSK